MEIEKLVRKNIRELKPYASARNEFSGEAMVFLDANENPYNTPYNRYPDPLQRKLKAQIALMKDIMPAQIFLGNGSDEPIDLLIRAFCEPGQNNIVTIDPTYGMYQVAAEINNIAVRKVSLTDRFALDARKLPDAIDEQTKLVFLCSPNNPTGNCLEEDALLEVIRSFPGLVVLDEAYIDFAPGKSLLSRLNDHTNLVVLQTFSKAWGMAGIRLGMAFASKEIINVLNKIKYPYNLNILTQEKALEFLDQKDQMKRWVKLLVAEREKMRRLLSSFPFVVEIYPSDANFILVKMHDARGIYDFLKEEGVIVRDRSKVHLCEESLRITIGSSTENDLLLKTLNELI